MAGGRKPELSMTANLKEIPRGEKKKYLEIGAAWPNDYGGFNFRLADGVKIRLKDGTIITGDSHWISVKDWRKGGSAGGSDDDDWGDSPPPPRDSDAPAPSAHGDDEIPFD